MTMKDEKISQEILLTTAVVEAYSRALGTTSNMMTSSISHTADTLEMLRSIQSTATKNLEKEVEWLAYLRETALKVSQGV